MDEFGSFTVVANALEVIQYAYDINEILGNSFLQEPIWESRISAIVMIFSLYVLPRK